jgi:hypothetical protein
MVAAAAVELSPELELALSLVKRVREIVVGLAGLFLRRLACLMAAAMHCRQASSAKPPIFREAR